MIKNIYILSITIMLLSTIAFITLGSKQTNKIDVNLINKDIISENEKLEAEIDKNIDKIKELIKTSQFNKASKEINATRQLASNLGNSEYIHQKLQSIDVLEKQLYTEWAKYLEQKAVAASNNNEWNDTLDYAEKSQNILKEKQITVKNNNKKLANKASHKIAESEFKELTSLEHLIPEQKEGKFDIEKYFELAKAYNRTQEYEKARDMLEKILILEPYNYKAMYELKQIYRKVSNKGEKRKTLQIKEKLAQVEWGYAVPMKNQISKKDIIPVTEIEDTTTMIQEKLDNIIIKKVAFDNASVNSIIDYIRRETESLDTKDHLGINIDLRAKNSSVGERKVTLDMNNVPLRELLRIICSITKLNYKVEEYAVIISDENLDNMELRYIPIKSDIINSIAEINNIEKTETLDIESTTDISSADETSITPNEITDEAIQTYFTERGVPFPSGSAISWDMPSSTLVIKNTPENFEIIQNLLNEIDFTPPLILIEVKFVELTYDKQEGLAFNFKLNLEQAGWDVNGGELNGNGNIVQTGDLLNMLTYSQNPINIGSVTGAFSFFLYALEQSKIAETISSPKLITKSGSTAFFEMVQDEYYATSWTVAEPEVVYNTVQLGYPTPNFEEMKMGVMLQATPTVGANNQTIFLDIYPLVKEFSEYDDYDYSATQFLMDIDGTTVTDTQAFQRNLKMPVIINRDIKSKLKINDGDTVVLGGMIKDSTSKVQDKYPILGDIPLIGRLFRSEYETIEQRNLLIFVTTKLVNPDGSLLHKPKPNGMFNFKNI